MWYARIILIVVIVSVQSIHSVDKSGMHMHHQHNLGEQQIKNIEDIFGVKADYFAQEGVIKVSMPRNDIMVSIGGRRMDPFMGFTSWMGFQKGGKEGIEAMVMGDIVLLEDEVAAVMEMALNNDIAVTALHNHFFFDQPKVYFMHIEAEGAAIGLALSLRKVLDAIKLKRPQVKNPESHLLNKITGSSIEKIMGVKGQEKEGMFKVVIGRQTHAACGCLVGKNMGINTWAAFAGTDTDAIVDGDFAVLEGELQNVLKSLTNSGMRVVAIHNHMIGESPRIIFLHYWGQGTVQQLATTLKRTIDMTSPMVN